MDLHVTTPVWESSSFARPNCGPTWLKMEAFQPSGSFKLRGSGRVCTAARDRGCKHLVTSSGGNAGLAVANAGARLGLPVTVVIPVTTSEEVRQELERLGARTIRHGVAWDEAHTHALCLAEQPDTRYVHPFDDPEIWDGHATLVDELVTQIERPSAVVLSVGGGGLACGVLAGLHRNGWGDVPVVAVETEGADSFRASLDAGELVTLAAITSIATTLGAKTVCRELLEWTRRHEIRSHRVTDRQAVEACLRFADGHRVLVEPSCGAALAAVVDPLAPLPDGGAIAVVVCGGAGVDRARLEAWDAATRPNPTGRGPSGPSASRRAAGS